MTLYTDEQQNAINSRDCNLLLSAAAGSGKTAVLVERIIQIVTDEKNPVDIDGLLVVTFTEAAAAEMKQRIGQAIAGRLETEPFNEHVRRQSMLLNKAQISTIHSFCNGIVRKYFHVIGVDPSYRIGDSTETALLQEEAMADVFEGEYDKKEPLFYDLIELYSDRFMDERLRELILRIYEFASNSPDPYGWLTDFSEYFHLEKGSSLDGTAWADMVKKMVQSQLKGVILAAEEAIHISGFDGGPGKYIETLQEDIALVSQLIKSIEQSLENGYCAFQNAVFSRLKTISAKDSGINEQLKEMVKDIRDKEIKFPVNKIKERFFFKDPREQLEDLKGLYPYMHKLARMVIDFSELYRARKRERNLLDFNDLEHFCLEIIKKDESIAKALKNQYREVYIDEYQDSNTIQETILAAVAGDRNRFMVGDVKQSIYKFRRARPEIFIGKYNTYSYDGVHRKIDLAKNFRSRKTVVDTVNFVFRQLMSRETGGIEYAENEALHYGASYPQPADEKAYQTEILLIDRDGEEDGGLDGESAIDALSSAELEAKAIAGRIHKMVSGAEKAPVYEKQLSDYRDATYGDIVILLRSMSDAGTLADMLNSSGIPAYAEVSGGYFQNIEVLTLMSFLRIIDNPRQDIHLIGVLHSPVYAMDANSLFAIRASLEKGDFYSAMVHYRDHCTGLPKAEDRRGALEKFFIDLTRWREMSRILPVSRMVSLLMDETGYYDYVGLMPGGAMRQANLKALVEHAAKYEKTGFKGLFYFVRYMERVMQKDQRAGDAKLVPSAGNAVRIMTIHKSKGLEFPIVFLSRLGSRFNRMDERQDIVLHSDYGFGPKYTDLARRIKYDTIARAALMEKIQEENFAEELRVLYVALTRAKEKLVLTGCLPKTGRRMEKWARQVMNKSLKIPASYIMKALCPLDWLMPVFLRHENAAPLLQAYGVLYEAGNKAVYSDTADFSIEITDQQALEQAGLADSASPEGGSEPVPPKKEDLFSLKSLVADVNPEIYKEISDKLNWSYPFEAEARLPSKILISEIKRNFYSRRKYEDGEFVGQQKPIYDEPGFLMNDRPLSPAEKGTALHTVMEHLDLKRAYTLDELESFIKGLCEKGLLTEQEYAAIAVDKIYNFILSPLAERIRNGGRVKKETPFVMEMEAQKAYLPVGYHPGAAVLVHGIVDCFFEEGDGIVVIDYKTDWTTPYNLPEIEQRYRIQLSIYKEALERAYGKVVRECIVYLFHGDQYITIDRDI